MNRFNNSFNALAEKAAHGDVTARRLLQRQLAPQMVQIVRCVIQERRDRSTLDRRILAEADRVGLNAEVASPDERERLILAVALRLCSSVVARLGDDDKRATDDTVRAFSSFSSRTND
jgi:hypothetical protein